MLRNERYIGQFVWNKRKWVKDPATGKRRYVDRPKAEWVRTDHPELAIVSEELWAKVQARHEVNARPSNRPRQPAGHLFSGLVRCDVCGGPMSVVGTARFGCSTRHARGATACANKSTISEALLNRKALAALRTHLASPEVESCNRPADYLLTCVSTFRGHLRRVPREGEMAGRSRSSWLR